MSKASLSRLEDFEKSSEWTNLANEINDLEKMCRLNNHRHSKKQVFKYHNYQRHSMPQVQKAKSVWIEPTTDEPNDSFEQPEADESYRWNWKPKTEFEKSYFFDDYSRENFHDDRQKRYSSLPYSEGMNDQRSTEYQKDQSPLLRAEQSQSCFSKGKLGQVYNNVNINDDSGPSHSGTRERLHEIFERNRYLRRKFFASMPNNDTTTYVGDLPKGFDNKNSNCTVSKYNNTGFGSTETLTSQSNQSSISSINDRKSRTQVNITPELVEEERCPDEFYKTFISNGNRASGENITSPTRESKLLVNILMGNKVYVLKEPSNFHDKVFTENFVDGDRYNTPNVWSMCCEQFNSKDEIEHENGKRESNFDTSLEYVTWTLPKSWHDDAGNKKDTIERDFACKHQDNKSQKKKNISESKSVDETVSVNNGCSSRTRRKELHSQKNLCKSLPNLSRFENKENIKRDWKQFISQTELGRVPRTEPTSLTLRKVKLVNVPPPLDMSRVNEKYEEMKAIRRRRSNDYTVDVSLVRNYNCPLIGEPTIIKEECSSDDNHQASDSFRESSCSYRGKWCKEETGNTEKENEETQPLSAMDDLQSPQLVNNYKKTSDPANLDSSLNEDDELADRTSSISGFEAGTGTTLPSVYGPIPYSQ